MNQTPLTPAAPTDTHPRPIALREPETPDEKRLIDAYLRDAGDRDVIRFGPYHDDRLDGQVREGRFERVVFANLDALLTTIWKDSVNLDVWVEKKIVIEILDTPLPQEQLRDLLRKIYSSHLAFTRRHRRRQRIAAIVLCLLALGAMAAMIWIIPRAR